MRFLFLTLSICFLSSCCKDPDPVVDDDIPACIQVLIDEFASSSLPECNATVLANVTSYQFQGEVVYAFDRGSCIADGDITVYDGDCEQICILGTIIGITECRGEPFSNAVEIEVLWEQ